MCRMTVMIIEFRFVDEFYASGSIFIHDSIFCKNIAQWLQLTQRWHVLYVS